MNKLIIYFLMLTLLVSFTFANQIELANGQKVEINDKFCQDRVKGEEILGDDFMAFCEENFVQEYTAPNQEAELVEPPKEVTIDNKQFDSRLAFSIIGLILVLILIVLILAHVLKKKKDDLQAINHLKPYISTLKKKGYSLEEIENMLIQKGYEDSFINKLLIKK